MDLHQWLTSFFSVLAYALPLFLAAHHFQDTGWKLGPPAYAGLLAAIATFAMTARMSLFLESQLSEPVAGWWSKEELVALFLSGLTALSLVTFMWVIPVIRESVLRIPAALGNWWADPRKVGQDFELAETERSRTFGGTIWEIALNGIRASAGCIWLVATLAWPAIPLVIEQARNQDTLLAEKHAQAVAETYRRQLRSYTLNAGARLNELVSTLLVRKGNCKTDGCLNAYARRIGQVVLVIQGYGFTPGPDSVYDITAVAGGLDSDLEKAQRFHAAVDELAARSWRVPLKPAVPPPVAEFDPAAAEREAEQRTTHVNLKLLDVLGATVTSPRQFILPLIKDTSMALALAFECIAIVLVFLISSRPDGKV